MSERATPRDPGAERGIRMRTARLFGRDHQLLGWLATIAEGPAAIAISRGGHAKQYDHTEPNEDAAGFVLGEGGTLVAVADGHHGAAGAQTAIAYLESEWGPRWTGLGAVAPTEDAWRDEARRAIAGANHAVLAEAAERKRTLAPSTLALAVSRPGEHRLLYAGIGDSHVFAVDATGAQDLLDAAIPAKRSAFLGHQALDAERLAEASGSGIITTSTLRAVVLATDGLSETGIGVADPAAAVCVAVRDSASADPELRPLALARAIGELALEAHRENASGDNIASAVVWPVR